VKEEKSKTDTPLIDFVEELTHCCIHIPFAVLRSIKKSVAEFTLIKTERS
jgi:hypothetical protein